MCPGQKGRGSISLRRKKGQGSSEVIYSEDEVWTEEHPSIRSLTRSGPWS